MTVAQAPAPDGAEMQKTNEDSGHLSKSAGHKRKRGSEFKASSSPDRQRMRVDWLPEPVEHNPRAGNELATLRKFSEDPYEYPINSRHPLETFFKRSEISPSDTSKNVFQSLLETGQKVPSESRFDDDKFQTTISRLEGHHEARIIKDIGYLVVASAEDLATAGHKDLKNLVETVDEPWSSCIKTCDLVPKPHYAVGFHWKAFSDDQLRVLDREEQRCKFRVSPSLYFPFLACQVTTMRGELGALRRNTHSAAVAMHGVVELFRRSKRESELHQEVLFFSVTYDCHRVAIYGHFVEIGDQETRYGSVLIKRNDFSSEPKNKWLSYEFTTSLYKIWAQMHLKRIRSVIDGLAAGQQVSKPNALSPGMTSPFNATPTIEAELAPDSTLLGEEAPQPSTLAHINEVCETKSPTASGQNHEDALPDNATHDDFVRYWSKTHSWPTKYFESGRPTKEDILRSISRSDSQRKIRIHPKITVAWSLSLPELDAGPSEPSFISERSAMFRSTGSSEARKHLLKNQKGIWFLQDHSRDPGEGLSSSAEEICRKLTQTEQSVPDSASENEFARILERMRGSGSSRTDIAINIGPKVAPRAETLFANGDDSLKYLTETIDETWSMCASIHKTYPPKPYYAAGFHREYAFTRSQRLILIELNRDLGVDKYHSLFWLAEDMYLPFLTVEPKSHSFAHAENFNIANTLVAMRGVVELFRAANRAPEIHREILAFSAVYTVDRIHMYVHFADVPDLYNSDGQCLRFYRHQVFTSHYMTQGWEVSYRFFKNIYKVFAPMHHARICSAIDSLARKPKVSTPAPADREPVDTVDTSQPQPPAPQSADHTKSLSNNDSVAKSTS